MTACDSKFYLAYLNKLVDQYNNTYHHSINKKPVNVDYSALTEKIETNSKAPRFKVNDRDRITKYKNNFSKGYTKNWSREIFIIDSVLKTNPWTYKSKDCNGETIIGNFMKNNCCEDFICLEAEVDKLDINKLINVPTILNNLKTKVDDLDVGKLENTTVELKKLSGVVDNEVVKNTKFNTKDKSKE